ncbi:MAG: hypothetical protein A3B96_04280 [Candidatus Spechtbacteria bacterium RIFCSPHIGHO2_02_FULL_43_15b]|uniref:Uncharacterized protein n=1 Tax=Candidatus Spechtbacteria bacterium RIFCSPHIGHO2_01_FULL_43_30 TaxID=1802158 RepID=A0A1G2H7J2_9BACT|nr:MAG: hypothetical protein A2827_01845 [Candidatus Spechtbacteria bacterium RIFCSPHIGHO2_01_FULL_43_30]OGZ58552.1 MAG: hypothetical protein A3B96_04280 [Candidatus Spechtbacteria bacterium RIFCSPHIGHO2_02_FULL_43_15b]
MRNLFSSKNRIVVLVCILGLLSVFLVAFVLNLIGGMRTKSMTPLPHIGAGAFHIEATLSDSGGADPETHFILYAKNKVSEGDVEKILKFEPDVKFSAKKIAELKIGDFAFAADTELALDPRVEIVPLEKLETDRIYKAVISDIEEAKIDRPYSFAFQIKSPFQVVETYPRNEAAYVPLNSGIEITFSRENTNDIEKFFEIDPDTEGTFERRGRTVVFMPKSLLEKTIYRVTVKNGLGVTGSNDKLAEDFSFVFETGEGRYTGSRPSFDFSGDFIEYMPGVKPVFSVSYYGINPKNLNIDVYKFNDNNEFVDSYLKSRNWKYGWAYYHVRDASSAYEPNKNQRILSFSPSIIKSGYQEFIEIPQVLDEGYYLLDVSISGRKEQAWLQITPISHYNSITHDSSIIWTYDFLDKEPIAGASVIFLDSGNSPAETKVGTTDSDGLLQFKTPRSLQRENYDNSASPRFLKISAGGTAPAYVKVADSWGYGYGASKGDEFWDYIATDRYAYQMNDIVRYWGVLKGRDMDLRQKLVEVGIYEGYSYYYDEGGLYSSDKKPLVSEKILVSQFDTIEGGLSFEGIAPGFYSVYVKFNGKTISSSTIQILTYAKPAYQIIVTPSKRAMFAGEDVTFDVSAKFFDGTPVSNLLLKYSGYWNSSFTGEIRLDKDGIGKFYFKTSYIRDEYSYYPTYYPKSLIVNFTPKLEEEGEVISRGSVLVFGPDMYLQSFSKKTGADSYMFTAKLNKIVISGKENSEDYWRNEYIGDPVMGHPLSAKITKITYDKRETGEYYDHINKIVRKIYEYERKETVIENVSGSVNSQGEWIFTRNFPQEEGSHYVIYFSGKDSVGRNISSSSYASFYSSYSAWKNFAVALSIGGESFSKEFSLGEDINLELKITEGEKPQNPKVLFYRFQNSIDEARVVSGMNLHEIFVKEFSPSVQYRAVILSPFGFEESNSINAAFKERDNNLNIEINSGKEKYRPGEEIQIDFSVKDESGNPMSAELNVSIIDEAIFHILPYNWQKRILGTLYRDLYTNPISNTSEYVKLDENSSASGGAEMGGCFTRGTPVLMEGGNLKSIEEVRVGDVVLTFEGENSKKLVPAIVQGVSSHTVDAFLVINGSLEVTHEHRLFVNGNWEYAGNVKLGDRLRDAGGKSQIISSIMEKQAQNTVVYNIMVDNQHTYFAGGYFVHNQEKGGGPSRSNFVDIALFETVRANSSGKASVKFNAPDNITAWRVTARAFESKEIKAGEKIELVETSLPFFVDATMNSTYLVGDEPIIRLRSFGDEYDPNRGVDFRLGVDDEVNGDFGIGAVFMPLKNFGIFQEGEHELFISAKQGNLEDSIIRKVNFVKSYFKKGGSSTYALSEDLTDIKGNKYGSTMLVFADAGRGKFYPTLWNNALIHGIRADQLAAKYFGEELLSRYFDDAKPDESLDLSGYQTPEGAIALFPYGDSDIEVTSKMADLAPEFIFRERVKAYLNKSLEDKKSDIGRAAKALYGLASLGEPVLTKINSIKASGELGFEDGIYIALSLAKIGDKESARIIYENDIRPNLRFDGKEAWLSSEDDMTRRVKLTATISVLSSYLMLSEDSASLWNYIKSHDPEKDLDVLEETLFMKSELENSKDNEAKFSYRIDDEREERVTLEKGKSRKINVFEDELKKIRFSDVHGNISVMSLYQTSVEPNELVRNDELSLRREYRVNGQKLNSFNEGDVVMVRLDPDIAKSAIDGVYQVIDYLPSGLKPATRVYETGLSNERNDCNIIWYPSKIVNSTVYFTINKEFDNSAYCQNRTINYYARVVSKGKYTANPAIIQSLKNLNSLNISREDVVEIR